MAAPNLRSLTTVVIKTAILEATNTMTDLIAAVASDHATNVEAVFASNIHASVAGWVTLVHKRSGTEHIIANQQRVNTKQTLNLLLGKSIYLEEGDSLRVQANASSNICVEAPYSDVT